MFALRVGTYSVGCLLRKSTRHRTLFKDNDMTPTRSIRVDKKLQAAILQVYVIPAQYTHW